MKLRTLMHGLVGAAICLAMAGVSPSVSVADFDPPKPKVDCTKKKNKDKPECKSSHIQQTDDEVYNAVYWLARQEKYAEALSVLGQAANSNTARLLNERGYITRKLGDVKGALGYYHQALALDPDYVFARAYMGEALIQMGDIPAARSQLSEIGTRCGTACDAYVHLAEYVAKAEATAPKGL